MRQLRKWEHVKAILVGVVAGGFTTFAIGWIINPNYTIIDASLLLIASPLITIIAYKIAHDHYANKEESESKKVL